MAEALGLPRFDLERATRTNATNIWLEMAAHRHGPMVALASLSGTYLKRGLLVQLFDLSPSSPWAYYVSLRRDLRGSAAGSLVDYIRTFATQM